MKFVSTLLMFFGYMLVYAAVAGSGKFATEPWAGLFADAYTESPDPKRSVQPGQRQPQGPALPPLGTAASVRPRTGTKTAPSLPPGPVFGTPR